MVSEKLLAHSAFRLIGEKSSCSVKGGFFVLFFLGERERSPKSFGSPDVFRVGGSGNCCWLDWLGAD
jgi:hypothetical protein